MAAYPRIKNAGTCKAEGRKEGHVAIALRVEMDVPISALRVIEADDLQRLKRNSGIQQTYSLGHTPPLSKQSPLFAILMVAHREDVKNCAEGKILVCFQNQAALRAISSPGTRSTLVQECGDALQSLTRQEQVELVWVSERMGIPGNERADQLARLGSREPCQGPDLILGISRGGINGTINKWAYQRLGMSWGTNTGCRQAHNFLDGPDRSKPYSKGSKPNEESPLCPECGEGEDTPIHLLENCTAFGRLRHKVFGNRELQGEKMRGLPWTKIFTS
ncbi:hypothetical protein NQ315_006691 [Exocentrus adspersus]|uniref:RNase H type-1 domain-containing protein n=1 Tax=Exocentrus adspersus TaxID=1586481 RepID=A0AAV8WD13_9CUCU|nr:hypothetical protein NQ315_006691 [Exocentrus adspersus]